MRQGQRVLAVVVVFLLVLAVPGRVLASPEVMKALGILEMRQPTLVPDVTMPTLAGAPLAMKDLKGSSSS